MITLTPKPFCQQLERQRPNIAAFNLDKLQPIEACVYSYAEIGHPELCCAIGAGLAPEQREWLVATRSNSFSITRLIDEHRAEVTSIERRDFIGALSELQCKHDGCLKIRDPGHFKECLAEFTKALDIFISDWKDIE